jgi:hypothetical protein
MSSNLGMLYLIQTSVSELEMSSHMLVPPLKGVIKCRQSPRGNATSTVLILNNVSTVIQIISETEKPLKVDKA